uniref:Small ribosomal subunit protein uS15m n=1 Tax=Caenorhabditis tropicalis TaxID=1561998 RepID=A0A1I7UY57_9PELO
MINLRRFVHTSCQLERGRTAFYNIHQKVTDPAKQDPDYFEKKARELPLVAWLTALIRHWSLLVNDIGQETKKKPTWLTHRIWLVINERRKALRILREQNESAFERTIAALKISYHVPKQPAHVKTRKAWAEAQLKIRVENEKEKRLEELHEKYDRQVEEHKRETQEKRKALNDELDKLAKQVRRIDEIEGKSFETVGKYEPALISSLTETVIHSNLFYHRPPTMTEK